MTRRHASSPGARLLGLVGLFGLFELSCAGAVNQMTASVDDYALYRETRVAGGTHARVRASWRYLRERPDGHFRGEVRPWFLAADAAWLAAAGRDPERLRAYLAAVPDGPHSDEAADRLADAELVAARSRRRDRDLSETARELEEKLGDAAAARRELVQRFARLVGLFAAVRSFGQGTPELDPLLIREWRVRLPEAHCTADRCTKTLSFSYAVPDDKKLTPRQAIFDAALVLDAGRVARAVVTGPELWSRIAEAADIRPVKPGDAQGRAEAIARTVQIVETSIAAALPASRCQQEAVSPIVLAYECDGVRLEMIAAGSVEEEDRIEIAPVGGRP